MPSCTWVTVPACTGSWPPAPCTTSPIDTSSIGRGPSGPVDDGAGRQTLIGVTDDADVAVAVGEQEHQFVLRLVRVLVLVDEDVFEPLAVVLEHVAVFTEQLDRVR